jgi:hypothetical protein
MVADRTGDLKMELTQEFLGQMLGTRRSSVTIAASSLQRSGFLDYRRRIIQILDRERLQDAACECYPITRRLFDHLYRNQATPPLVSVPAPSHPVLHGSSHLKQDHGNAGALQSVER